jgi:hypothetical protein
MSGNTVECPHATGTRWPARNSSSGGIGATEGGGGGARGVLVEVIIALQILVEVKLYATRYA